MGLAMSTDHTLPLHLLAQPLVLTITLAHWTCPNEVNQFVKELHAYTTALGIDIDVGSTSICLRPGRRHPSMRDRSTMLSWLIGRHEVIDLTITPRPTSDEFLQIALFCDRPDGPRFVAQGSRHHPGSNPTTSGRR